MAALDDLKAAEASVATAVQNAITLIQNLQSGSVPAADVETVVSELNAAAQSLNSATGAVTNPPPTPTP